MGKCTRVANSNWEGADDVSGMRRDSCLSQAHFQICSVLLAQEDPFNRNRMPIPDGLGSFPGIALQALKTELSDWYEQDGDQGIIKDFDVD